VAVAAHYRVIAELAEEGPLPEPLLEEAGNDLDPFDLICHVKASWQYLGAKPMKPPCKNRLLLPWIHRKPAWMLVCVLRL
jgi:hypothetical protein